jgi:hypothetical protein
MVTEIEQSELDKKVNAVIAANEGYAEIELSLEQQQKYLSRYSFSALVCSAVYYWYMKDKVFFWISIVSSLLFFPILFILPLLARQRAWKMHEWRSFGHFESVQKKWDRASIYVLVITVFVFSLTAYYEVRFMTNLLNDSGINNLNDVQKMQDDLENTLGN